MEEDIEYLEDLIVLLKHEPEDNPKAFLEINSDSQKEIARAIENLINRCKEQEKMINMMAVSINVYDSQLVINTFKDKEDVKEFFRKKAKGE